MSSKVKIAAIQMDCSADYETNLGKAVAKIKEAASMGSQIVCLPELFTTHYFCTDEANQEAFKLAEKADGRTAKALSEAAKENGVYLVCGSIFEDGNDGKYYNTALTFDDQGVLISKYRKCHIPQDPGFYEKDYFTAGDKIEVFDTKYGKICVMICFDQWFTEAAREATLQGAQILIYPTAIGMPNDVENITGDWRAKWQGVQIGHACANDVYVVAINRVGNETSKTGSITEFFGGSFICDFAGKKLDEGDKQEKILIAECDLDQQKEVQGAWCLLANRRPALYNRTSGRC